MNNILIVQFTLTLVYNHIIGKEYQIQSNAMMNTFHYDCDSNFPVVLNLNYNDSKCTIYGYINTNKFHMENNQCKQVLMISFTKIHSDTPCSYSIKQDYFRVYQIEMEWIQRYNNYIYFELFVEKNETILELQMLNHLEVNCEFNMYINEGMIAPTPDNYTQMGIEISMSTQIIILDQGFHILLVVCCLESNGKIKIQPKSLSINGKQVSQYYSLRQLDQKYLLVHSDLHIQYLQIDMVYGMLTVRIRSIRDNTTFEQVISNTTERIRISGSYYNLTLIAETDSVFQCIYSTSPVMVFSDTLLVTFHAGEKHYIMLEFPKRLFDTHRYISQGQEYGQFQTSIVVIQSDDSLQLTKLSRVELPIIITSVFYQVIQVNLGYPQQFIVESQDKLIISIRQLQGKCNYSSQELLNTQFYISTDTLFCIFLLNAQLIRQPITFKQVTSSSRLFHPVNCTHFVFQDAHLYSAVIHINSEFQFEIFQNPNMTDRIKYDKSRFYYYQPVFIRITVPSNYTLQYYYLIILTSQLPIMNNLYQYYIVGSFKTLEWVLLLKTKPYEQIVSIHEFNHTSQIIHIKQDNDISQIINTTIIVPASPYYQQVAISVGISKQAISIILQEEHIGQIPLRNNQILNCKNELYNFISYQQEFTIQSSYLNQMILLNIQVSDQQPTSIQDSKYYPELTKQYPSTDDYDIQLNYTIYNTQDVILPLDCVGIYHIINSEYLYYQNQTNKSTSWNVNWIFITELYYVNGIYNNQLQEQQHIVSPLKQHQHYISVSDHQIFCIFNVLQGNIQNIDSTSQMNNIIKLTPLENIQINCIDVCSIYTQCQLTKQLELGEYPIGLHLMNSSIQIMTQIPYQIDKHSGSIQVVTSQSNDNNLTEITTNISSNFIIYSIQLTKLRVNLKVHQMDIAKSLYLIQGNAILQLCLYYANVSIEFNYQLLIYDEINSIKCIKLFNQQPTQTSLTIQLYQGTYELEHVYNNQILLREDCINRFSTEIVKQLIFYCDDCLDELLINSNIKYQIINEISSIVIYPIGNIDNAWIYIQYSYNPIQLFHNHTIISESIQNNWIIESNQVDSIIIVYLQTLTNPIELIYNNKSIYIDDTYYLYIANLDQFKFTTHGSESKLQITQYTISYVNEYCFNDIQYNINNEILMNIIHRHNKKLCSIQQLEYTYNHNRYVMHTNVDTQLNSNTLIIDDNSNILGIIVISILVTYLIDSNLLIISYQYMQTRNHTTMISLYIVTLIVICGLFIIIIMIFLRKYRYNNNRQQDKLYKIEMIEQDTH